MMPVRLYRCLTSNTWTLAFFVAPNIVRLAAGWTDRVTAVQAAETCAAHLGLTVRWLP